MAQLCHCHDQEEKHKLPFTAERKVVRMVKSQPKSKSAMNYKLLEDQRLQVKCVLHQYKLRGCRAEKRQSHLVPHLKARPEIAADHMEKENTAAVCLEVRRPLTPTTPDLLSNRVLVVLCCGAVLLL